MEQAITALLSHRSVDEAARAVGISPNTLLRWMKEPEFEAALQEARRMAFSQAIGRLQDAGGAAVTTVLKIMLDPKTPAGTRLRAAEVVLEQGTKATDMEELEDRVAKLERTAASGRKPRRRPVDVTWLNAKIRPVTPQAQIAGPPPDRAEADPDEAETDENVVE
jgi:hypothetical protein